MEGHCWTDQSPQWAVVPMEEEEKKKKKKKKKKKEKKKKKKKKCNRKHERIIYCKRKINIGHQNTCKTFLSQSCDEERTEKKKYNKEKYKLTYHEIRRTKRQKYLGYPEVNDSI